MVHTPSINVTTTLCLSQNTASRSWEARWGSAFENLIRDICKTYDVEILKGHIRPDHVHLLLSVPPTLSPSRVMNAIKGKSSNRLLRDFRTLNKTFWGRHLWARGYFVATSGNVTDEVIARYIEEQDIEPEDADFKVTE